MSEAWLNFAVVIFVQLLLFIVHAYYEKRLVGVLRILERGVVSGIALGLFFELVLGKIFGLWLNTLGFDVLFLTLNIALLYGLFAANTLLMQQARLAHFYIWTMIVGAVSEITNLFFPMFAWGFAYLPPVEYLFVLSIGYFGGAVLVAAVWHVFLGRRFFFISNLLKK